MTEIRNLKSVQPEPNRLILLFCCDWSGYEIKGMFIPFKQGSGKRTGQPRFCIQSPTGEWVGHREAWQDCETWMYLEETKNE